MNIKNCWNKHKFKVLTGVATVGTFVGRVYAVDDMTTTITDWLPTIISFAMLGMVLGMLDKFANKRK